MATRTVTHTLRDGAGRLAPGYPVLVEVGGDIGDGRGWQPVPAFLADGSELVVPAKFWSDMGDGHLEFQLPVSADLTPANLFYRVTLPGNVRHFFTVPAGSGPVALSSLYTSTVTLLPSEIAILQAEIDALAGGTGGSGVEGWLTGHGPPPSGSGLLPLDGVSDPWRWSPQFGGWVSQVHEITVAAGAEITPPGVTPPEVADALVFAGQTVPLAGFYGSAAAALFQDAVSQPVVAVALGGSLPITAPADGTGILFLVQYEPGFAGPTTVPLPDLDPADYLTSGVTVGALYDFPDVDLGVDGDFYLDLDSHLVYQKTAGAWSVVGFLPVDDPAPYFTAIEAEIAALGAPVTLPLAESDVTGLVDDLAALTPLAADVAALTAVAVAGVALRSSTAVGDATATTATDGVVTASGAADMRFDATGGLFRLTNGHAFFHDPHAWVPPVGDATDDRIDAIYVSEGGPDAGSDPAGAGYNYNVGAPAPSPVMAGPDTGAWAGWCLVASILVPAGATRSDACTITDRRVFV